MTNKELMLLQKLYKYEGEELHKMRSKARSLTRLINLTTEEQKEERAEIYPKLFGRVGKNCYIEPPFYTDYGCNTFIGDNFFANYDCIFIDVAKITIGDNVFIAPRVGLYTAGHPIDPDVRNTHLEYGHEIVIGNNVWIGAHSVINPGVKIGDNAVIGSGSVVTKDIPENTIAAGVPCRVIREITEEDREYWNNLAGEYYKEFTK